MKKNEFEAKCGLCESWSVATFLDKVPDKYSIFNKDGGNHRGHSVVALSGRETLVSGVRHKDKNHNDISYMGIGTETMAQGYMLPFDTKNSYLKYSFYNCGDKKFKYDRITLKVPIKELKIEPGTEICITTIIDVNDLVDAMNGVYETKRSITSRSKVEESNRYGVVVEMPHYNLVNYGKQKVLR